MHAIRAAYLGAGTIIMAVALGLALFLGITSFDIEHQRAYEKLYMANAMRLKEFVQQGIWQGKVLESFADVGRRLEQLRADDGRIATALVSDSAGRVVFAASDDVSRSVGEFERLSIEGDSLTEILSDEYWFGVRFSKPEGGTAGWVVLQVDGHERELLRTQLFRNQLLLLLGLIVAGFVLMAVLLRRFFKRARMAIAILLTFTQLVFGVVTMNVIHTEYNRLFLETADRQARFLNDDAKRLLGFGLEPVDWRDMSAHMKVLLKETDVAREIRLYDTAGRVLYGATRTSETYVVNPARLGPPQINVRAASSDLLPVRVRGVLYGYIEIRIDESLISDKLLRLALELATVLLVSSLIAVELVRMISIFARRRRQGSPSSLLDGIRVTSFVFHIAALVPLSFIPLFLNEVVLSTMPWLSGAEAQNLLSVLMTAYMVGVALAVPLNGWLSRNLSLRSVLVFAAFAFVVGSLGTWLLKDFTLLFLTRSLAGIGFGLMAMAGSSLVSAMSHTVRYSVGTRNWTTGFSSGAVCAFSLGSLVAERFGYGGAMILSVALMVGAGIFATVAGKRLGFAVRHKPERIRLRDLSAVFTNRDIASLLLFAAFPLQLAMVGLLQYVFPLYMSYRGLDQADIGRMLAIYGIVNLVAPTVSRFREQRSMLRIFVVSGNLIAGIVLVYTYLADNILVLIVAMAAIGISSMIFDLVMDAFSGRGPGGGLRQQTRAVALYTSYERLIASIVPILTALMVSLVGMSGSIAVIGMLAILGAAAFALLSPQDEEERS